MRGDHGLKSDLEAIASAVQAWLASVVAEATLSASPEFGHSLRRFRTCRLVIGTCAGALLAVSGAAHVQLS